MLNALVYYFIAQVKPFKALKCDEDKNLIDSYIFLIPEKNWNIYDSWDHYEQGQLFVFSELCNPNFVGKDGLNCEDYANDGFWCTTRVELLNHYAVMNKNGNLETIRQCPQCGCGEDGAANLNELYAKELEFDPFAPRP